MVSARRMGSAPQIGRGKAVDLRVIAARRAVCARPRVPWTARPIAQAAWQPHTDLTMSEDPADTDPPARAIDQAREGTEPSTPPTVDDMGEWSFPASDPPATWTWDVERPFRN
jgi:hypothetical protein